MFRLTRILVGVGLAGLAWSALVLEKRRSRRLPSAAPPHRIAPAPPADDEARSKPKPLLSPGWFTISHFGLLALLTAMVVAGLLLRGIRRYPVDPVWHISGGDAQRGRQLLVVHGCGGCHTIRGIREATGTVGPPLEDFAGRMYIGGQLANTPENLIAWIQDPQQFAPGTAMPNLAITEPAARDMAAYLYKP